MTPFDYKSQNPLSFACLRLIRALVIFTPLGIQNLNKKRKSNWILIVVVKWRHREVSYCCTNADSKLRVWCQSTGQPPSVGVVVPLLPNGKKIRRFRKDEKLQRFEKKSLKAAFKLGSISSRFVRPRSSFCKNGWKSSLRSSQSAQLKPLEFAQPCWLVDSNWL